MAKNRGFNSRPRTPGASSRPAAGGIYTRGDGLGRTRPAGNRDGYSGRSGSSSGPDRAGGSSSIGAGLIGLLIGWLLGKGGSSSGGSGSSSSSSKSGCITRLIILIVIIVAIIFILNMCSGSSSSNFLSSFFSTDSYSWGESTAVTDFGEASFSGNISDEEDDTTNSTGLSYAGDSANNDISAETGITGARTKRTVLKGNGEDVVTIMIYMCGTDLESNYGMATNDLQEMLAATISDKVNVIIETGGTKKWQNKTISSKYNQRYKVTSDGLVRLEKNLGKKSMTDPETLTDFIKYCADKFPANRNILIMWDHGGGSISGYGYDEYFSGDSMTIDEINSALANAGISFDIVGFDACLMATVETAYMLNYHSDYMLASEETEPGIGWYYTDWLTALSKNTSISTPELGKLIIDDYTQKCREYSSNEVTTLSLIDLVAFNNVTAPAISNFAQSAEGQLDNNEYSTISTARANSREFADSEIDQVDFMDLANRVDTTEARALVSALQKCIVYNKTSRNVTNANGLSVYFPYDELSNMKSMLRTYDSMGMDDNYTDLITKFANLVLGGQISTGGSSSAFDFLTGDSSSSTPILGDLLTSFLDQGDFSSILGSDQISADWIDVDFLKSKVDYFSEQHLAAENITLTEKDGKLVLDLSDEDWAKISMIELNVFVDDGSGYIDLGLDNIFTFTDEGDLLIDYDGCWLAINDYPVAYYLDTYEEYGDSWKITGRIPVMLNDQLADIVVTFDSDSEYGTVAGARLLYTEGETETYAKGLTEIKEGDTIDFICDYYTYNEEFTDSYFLGERLVVGEEGLSVGDVNIGSYDCKVTYRLTDLYGNTYWTPAVDYNS